VAVHMEVVELHTDAFVVDIVDKDCSEAVVDIADMDSAAAAAAAVVVVEAAEVAHMVEGVVEVVVAIQQVEAGVALQLVPPTLIPKWKPVFRSTFL